MEEQGRPSSVLSKLSYASRLKSDMKTGNLLHIIFTIHCLGSNSQINFKRKVPLIANDFSSERVTSASSR